MPSDTGFLDTLLGSVLTSAIIAGVMYVYVSWSLMVIARKTGTPNEWMAWVPVLNAVLMCQIARKSAVWVVLLMLPLLVFFFLPASTPFFVQLGAMIIAPIVAFVTFLVIWAGIARARGKSGATALLFLVPLIGLIVPGMLAAGDATIPDAETQTVYKRPTECSSCGILLDEEDVFCGDCGSPVQEVAYTTPVAASAGSRSGSLVPALVIGAIVIAGVGYVLYSGYGTGGTVDRQPPALPARMAGVMTEFPVDTETTNAARPTGVITSSFSGESQTTEIPAKRLPPGVTNSTIASSAQTATSTQYRTPGEMAPVSVTVVDPAPGTDPGQEIATVVTQNTGGERSGVRVQSPQGRVYSGSRVETPEIVVFVLVNESTGNVVIVYASDPEAKPAAVRLASNVGNGNGLMDDPDFQRSVGAIPAVLPEGLTLIDSKTTTRAQILGEFAEAEAEFGGNAEFDSWMSQITPLVPSLITESTYLDSRNLRWEVSLLEYPSGMRAWFFWNFLKRFASMGDEPTRPAEGLDGMYVDGVDGPALIMRKGAYILSVQGPPGVDSRVVRALAEAYQI